MSTTPATLTRPEIRAALDRLRRRIRVYVLLQGTAAVILTLAMAFWVSLIADWAYFRLSSLELPVWFRKGFTIAAGCAFVWGVSVWVLFRLLRRLRPKALALLLERRFPELSDRLITAVEWGEAESGTIPPLTASMYSRTVDEAARAVGQLHLAPVFNPGPLRRTVVVAALLVVSIVGFAATNLQAMSRWSRAYLAWDDMYWQRETELIIQVLAEPGDRIREFKNGTYKHPRGADLTLLVAVAEGKTVPEHVEIDYDLASGRGGGRSFFSPIGDGRFQFTLGGLLEDLEFRVRGGDFVNRRPLRVAVVDPPRVDGIVLECDYPDYTGLDQTDSEGNAVPHSLAVRGNRVSLPMETECLMQVTTNKPLAGVAVETDGFSVRLAPGRAWLTLPPDGPRDGRQIPLSPAPNLGGELLAGESGTFRLPLLVSAKAAASLTDWSGSGPIPLPPDSLLRIHLEDADEVMSIDPARLTINGIVDTPPSVETELRGIGSAVTRKAVIPVKGTVRDDYGVVAARFDFRVGDDDDAWRARPFHRPPAGTPTELQLQRTVTEPFERFDVLPLDLPIGQKLTLTVYARDGDNQNGPHENRGPRYVFEIVSNEELLSIIYGKELNLRRRFERIIEEVQHVRDDLLLHGQQAEQIDQRRSRPAANAGEADANDETQLLETAVAVAAERALHQIRKNANETSAVEEAFREILEELVNNAVHTTQMVDRIDGLIVVRLRSINTRDFPEAEAAVNAVRRANQRNENLRPPIAASIAAVDRLLDHMRTVLNEMEDLVKFHEAIQRLKTIIDDQESISDETRQEQKRKLLDRLKELNLE